MVQRDHMPTYTVQTAQNRYETVVERGILARAAEYVPQGAGKLFVVTTRDVWDLHREALDAQITSHAHVLFFPGGEPNKRLACLEELADQIVELGADRTSFLIGFGGGIVTDISGFLAAVFMRGISVLQIPTTLLAQVDAAVGGKTGVNLAGGKNLIGSFHQPAAVLIDGQVLATLPEREYRAGLYEVIKCAIIRDRELFRILKSEKQAVLARDRETVDSLVSASVRIKAEVVSADERESDLRRILNFGHTIGHAVEAETQYKTFLHGEAVGWGMLAALRLAELAGELAPCDAEAMRSLIEAYGPLPPAAHLSPDSLLARLTSDKKTLKGKVHFVLPTGIGAVRVVSGLSETMVRQAMTETFTEKVSA